MSLGDHEKHFHLLIHHIVDGVVIVGTDGSIRFTNPAAEQLFHRTSEQLTGAPFGFPVTGNHTTEIEILSENGQSTPVEMRVVPIEWENEPAYLASLRDVTERWKREKAMREHMAALEGRA